MNLEKLYRHAPVGLCYFDTGLRYVYINEWLATINGLTIQQHLGQRIGDLLPDVAAGVEPQLRRVIETGEPIIRGTAHVETPAHPGSRRHYEHNYYPAKSDDGTVVGLSCVIQDVTERTDAEIRLYADLAATKALLKSEEKAAPVERPDVYVLRIDPTIPSSRDEVLARLRHPDGDGLHTSYWRFETGHGDVLAERSGGEVTIYRDVCRRVLGEEP